MFSSCKLLVDIRVFPLRANANMIYKVAELYFVTSAVISDINGKIGDIESALDELHNYATSLIGGEA